MATARWPRWTTRWSSWPTPPLSKLADRICPWFEASVFWNGPLQLRRQLLRRLATPLLFLAVALLAAACGGDDDSAAAGGDGVVITTLAPADTAPTAAVEQPTSEASDAPTAAPAPTDEPASATISGFIYPIAGACLPTGDQLMPNAPREYRNGFHEGIDFYNVDNCAQIGGGTPVVAAKGGTVIRADLDYVDLTQERYNQLQADLTSPETLDVFRGRQVWIDHGNGIVTRYCHLSAIADGVAVGTTLNAGDLVAYVGESGTPESITNPGSEYHLHFEVRVGDSFLGAGLPPDQVRALYLELFG
jgi:murein DD-endopeptidase MepM/ murein hydrolase activator NlpD